MTPNEALHLIETSLNESSERTNDLLSTTLSAHGQDATAAVAAITLLYRVLTALLIAAKAGPALTANSSALEVLHERAKRAHSSVAALLLALSTKDEAMRWELNKFVEQLMLDHNRHLDKVVAVARQINGGDE